MEKTLGEKRVRVEFNPSDSTLVSQIKQKSAELINLVNSITLDGERFKENKDGIVGEAIRLKSLALTSYEEAAMWAVKAATI